MNNEDGDGDDACSQVASDTFVDAVILQRDVDDRQITDVLQCSRRRRKVTEYLSVDAEPNRTELCQRIAEKAE